MTIDRTSKYNYREICDELGITLDDLLSLVNNKSQNLIKNDATLLSAINHFENHIQERLRLKRISTLTVRHYRYFLNRLKKFIKYYNEQIQLSQFNEMVLHQFFIHCEALKSECLSINTQNNYTSIVRKLLSYSYQLNLTDRDYSKNFTWHRTELLPRYLNEEQVSNVMFEALQKTHGIRCHAIVTFLLGTGCRISEAVNIKVKDFDIQNNLVFIKAGKGNKDRFIPMYPKVKQVILDYLKMTGVYTWHGNITGYLFSRDFGEQRYNKISIRSIQDMMSNIYKKLGYNSLTVHSLRHTFAVRCLKAGMKLHYLSQILGHKNINTTYIYVQMFPKDLQDEVINKFPFPFEKLIGQVLKYDEDENNR